MGNKIRLKSNGGTMDKISINQYIDTHLGSGSSMIAAWAMGFDFVGMERNIIYYEAAIKRFLEFMAQPLFEGYGEQSELFQ
jgi:hypothetical protein